MTICLMGLVASQQCRLRCAVTWMEPKTTRSRAGLIVSLGFFFFFCWTPLSLGRMARVAGERAGCCAVRLSSVQHEVRTLWGAVYTRLLITHTTVSRRSCRGGGRKTIWQLPSTTSARRINTAGEAKGVQIQPNYIYLYLLPGITAAGRRPCVTGGKATACFSYRAAI